ncbi:NADPH-dependent FMN reductase [Caulobacter mirabilis]|uniref:FMN reductase n=1 Tax=Caulobacter mirabilis TaxID=69666 RepID=A0A2D2B0H4_9CAUL|nr:NADPH-dependent FMN reductase [Caulobacter mirabilis]ATQ43755.1 FMN reductase [Caulobacter mirabilis]
MKLLGVSGSLRKASFNTALLRAAEELLPQGAALEIFGLHDLPLFNADVEAEGDPAPVQAWKDAVRAADGVLFACPEYNGGVTGVLKNAVDWASRGAPAPLLGKLCCIVGASPGATGTVRAQDALRLNLRRAGAEVGPLGEVLVFQAHTKIIDGQLADEKTVAFLGRHLAAYVDELKARQG